MGKFNDVLFYFSGEYVHNIDDDDDDDVIRS